MKPDVATRKGLGERTETCPVAVVEGGHGGETCGAAKLSREPCDVVGNRPADAVHQADSPRPARRTDRAAKGGCQRRALGSGVGDDRIGQGHQIEEVRRIGDRIGREACMQVLDDFEVAAPAAERDIPGADKDVGVPIAEQHAHFGVEHAGRARDRLDLVVSPGAASALLTQTGADALGIGEDEGFAPATAEQPVKQDSLEEGEA